jgi:hypothetical protein
MAQSPTSVTEDAGDIVFADTFSHSVRRMMILLLLFLQKQSLAFAVYLFGIGTLHIKDRERTQYD